MDVIANVLGLGSHRICFRKTAPLFPNLEYSAAHTTEVDAIKVCNIPVPNKKSPFTSAIMVYFTYHV